MSRIALLMAAPQVKPVPTPAALANGYTVWRGPSRHDGKPIVVVITGLLKPSENPKTGPMPQVWVLREDISPVDAVASGDDESVCNACPFRDKLRREEGGGVACYVTVHYAVGQVWRSYHAGKYPKLTRKRLASLLKFKRVRGGAYGNLSNAPYWVSRIWADHAQKHTQYDHNWAECDPRFANIAMASVGSVAEKEMANGLGWRTFRVKQPGDAVLSDERECPAQDKFRALGRHVTCFDCGACHGTNGTPGKANIVIDDHGRTSRAAIDKRWASRRANAASN